MVIQHLVVIQNTLFRRIFAKSTVKDIQRAVVNLILQQELAQRSDLITNPHVTAKVLHLHLDWIPVIRFTDLELGIAIVL